LDNLSDGEIPLLSCDLLESERRQVAHPSDTSQQSVTDLLDHVDMMKLD
jgi:hypothetical protein